MPRQNLNYTKVLSPLKEKSFRLSWLRPFLFMEIIEKENSFSLLKDYEKNKIKKIKLSGELVRDFVPVNFLKSILRIINLDDDIGVLNICSWKAYEIEKFVRINIKDKKNLIKLK